MLARGSLYLQQLLLMRHFPYTRLTGQLKPTNATRDAHHPAPLGCRPAVSAQAQCDNSRPCFLADIDIAMGAFAAGDPGRVWEAVDAILNVGPREHAGYVQQSFVTDKVQIMSLVLACECSEHSA